jgi:hypothetical protein
MPYLRFLYFITALLALQCFASNARSQCSSTCGGPCLSNSSIISFGQTYWSCNKPATCESVRGCACTTHTCWSSACLMTMPTTMPISPACCSYHCVGLPNLPPPCRGTQCY